MDSKEIDLDLDGIELFIRSIEDAALRLQQEELSETQLARSEKLGNRLVDAACYTLPWKKQTSVPSVTKRLWKAMRYAMQKLKGLTDKQLLNA